MDAASSRRPRIHIRVHSTRLSSYAELFVLDILTAVEHAAHFPLLGRVVPEFKDDQIREWLLGNYRVIYRLLPGAIELLTIFHGSRLLRRSQLQGPD